jgi:hypothetical protein
MLVQRLHQGKSIPSGHCDVTYQYVRNLTPDCCQGVLRRLRSNSNRTKPSQKFRERLARIAMIFNDEDPTPFKRARLCIRDFGTTLLPGQSLYGLQRQRHREGGTLVHPFTIGSDAPAVQFDQLARDRKSETQSVVLSGGAAVGLPEHVKHEGQELGADSLAGVAHGQGNLARAPLEADPDAAASRIEFDGVGHEIGDHLLKAFGISIDAKWRSVPLPFDLQVLGFGPRPYHIQGAFDERYQIDLTKREVNLALRDP